MTRMMKNSKFTIAYLHSMPHFKTITHAYTNLGYCIEVVANDYDPYSMSISDVG